MVLWTIQHKCAYEEMRKKGVLRANEARICDDSFKEAYLWISSQMTKRMGNSPEGVIFPVWAWYQWEGKRKRLDMRIHGRHWGKKGSPIVLLTIDVPDKFVLLSDFDYWHVVLNNGDIIFPYRDEAIYSQAEKQKSWENIFDIDCSYDGESHPFLTTQATLWEIRWEWVIKAEHFISR
ncbi:hypothetical protein acsn021_39030 [Anaerocolumna cellulosilytica]|uniref:Uncharacterized protein n=1 Tax=Anaerocolumna cellulosilytica TaxID=433286 RepID=A0A6S6R090_9FIRM|nr:DUF3841 domain-containing protein [Anaerocolumna cellulosilytica]MBB5196303.1 hypothetical protein [Anaerocolumna cellulosilytica]BCJ96334.1 hypothetical protein acsn021_39030 [Anaerocolumna cellulosilytica]